MDKTLFFRLLQNYEGISSMLKRYDKQEIMLQVSELLAVTVDVLAQYPHSCFSGEEGIVYELVLQEFQKNIYHYDWVYDRLVDEVSKKVFNNLMQFRIIPDIGFLNNASDFVNEVISDKDIEGKSTFHEIHLDGKGLASVINAKNYIENELPKLSICICDKISYIWEIPRIIYNISPAYQFYIRQYKEDQKTKIYAIPRSDVPQIESSVKAKHIIALAPYERGWSNVELVKDCGLIPYLLYKNHNCAVSMVGAPGENYTYLEEYVKGLNMEFLPNGNIDEKAKYIVENANQIDCLILRGCYPTNFIPARLYKQLNPNGRIYVGLDANSQWMDRIIWTNTDFVEFMNHCDVIATSCKAMQRHLNEKWPWNIECIPNGYYSFGSDNVIPDFNEKENVIMTVGRLGTAQKATNILMEAFADIADKIPDWNLHLVGSVENGFRDFIALYFKTHPQLKERVLFTGPITEKEELMKHYRKAKIFALSSVVEGGSPNVVSEALNSGCVLAMTKIDAYGQSIDYGRCGMAAEINDIKGFANILLILCTNKNLSSLSEHAYQYGRKCFDMEKIVAKLYYMIFGGQE